MPFHAARSAGVMWVSPTNASGWKASLSVVATLTLPATITCPSRSYGDVTGERVEDGELVVEVWVAESAAVRQHALDGPRTHPQCAVPPDSALSASGRFGVSWAPEGIVRWPPNQILRPTGVLRHFCTDLALPAKLFWTRTGETRIGRAWTLGSRWAARWWAAAAETCV